MRFALPALGLLAALALPGAARSDQPGAHFIENWDMDGDSQVTLAEAERKRGEIFFMFDQDENGVLDSAEYDLFDETRQADMQANAAGQGKGPMQAVAQGLQREHNDANGDGAVSQAEFTAATPGWFAKVDRNGDGVVTVADFGGRN